MTFIEAEQPIDRLVETLNAIPKVAWIVTYPSMLTILVKEKEAGRLQIEPALFRQGARRSRTIFASGFDGPFPRCNTAFSTPMAAPSAWCFRSNAATGGKHVNEDWVIFEAVDEAMRPVPDGTVSATVLLTVLANDVQPFIRYDLGDCVRILQGHLPLWVAVSQFSGGRDARRRSFVWVR